MSAGVTALRHPRGVSRIAVGEGALQALADALGDWVAGRTVLLVTTPRVWDLHGGDVAALLAPAAACHRLEVPEGEAAKTLDTAESLWRRMLAAGGKRDSRVVGFGGGSVADLAGFAAGCFLRGVACAQLPTTLLAQVDAAIGGKTGIDLPQGKNSVGLFHHPEYVVGEARWLKTLPEQEVRSGLMEVVKAGFVLDAGLFGRLEEDLERLLAGDPAALGPVAAAAARAKVGVVERDPEEAGERMLLNFGHTLGHALEAASGYRGLRHGEAVAYGMLFALRLAVPRGLPQADAARLVSLLRRCRLPPLPEVAGDALLELMWRDKKAREEGQRWVLPARAGEGRIATDVSEQEVAGRLAGFLADPWGAPGAGL
ncbi:MAG TPA: 3-dehydroquinate synthase [Thermoanaerobaculia bacterium]|nr:3-dehydroquinate synthase [Thermoanaerobaculia bacterium]